MRVPHSDRMTPRHVRAQTPAPFELDQVHLMRNLTDCQRGQQTSILEKTTMLVVFTRLNGNRLGPSDFSLFGEHKALSETILYE